MDITNKDYWRALLMRAIHAVWETAVATLPATIVITPVMIEQFNWETARGVFYAVLAWALSAIFAGCLSALKSAKAGMPEVQLAGTLKAFDANLEPGINHNVEEDDE